MGTKHQDHNISPGRSQIIFCIIKVAQGTLGCLPRGQTVPGPNSLILRTPTGALPLDPSGRLVKCWVRRVSLLIHCNPGRPQATPATQTASRKSCDKKTKQIWRGIYLFVSRENSYKSALNRQNALNRTYKHLYFHNFPIVIPQTLVKKGNRRSRGRMGKEDREVASWLS